jgi:hypothetical protein
MLLLSGVQYTFVKLCNAAGQPHDCGACATAWGAAPDGTRRGAATRPRSHEHANGEGAGSFGTRGLLQLPSPSGAVTSR